MGRKKKDFPTLDDLPDLKRRDHDFMNEANVPRGYVFTYDFSCSKLAECGFKNTKTAYDRLAMALINIGFSQREYSGWQNDRDSKEEIVQALTDMFRREPALLTSLKDCMLGRAEEDTRDLWKSMHEQLGNQPYPDPGESEGDRDRTKERMEPAAAGTIPGRTVKKRGGVFHLLFFLFFFQFFSKIDARNVQFFLIRD